MKNVVLLIAIFLQLACTTSQLQSKLIVPLAINNDWQTLNTIEYKGKRDDISFISEARGWYGTGKGDLYTTDDGGSSWTLIASRPGTFIRSLGFIDENVGYIGNVGTDYYPGVTDETPLYKTSDGGKNWIAVDTGATTIKGICAIDILSTSRIYQGELITHSTIHAAGRVGGPTGILRSTNSGDTWKVIDMSDHAGMILDIKFFDEKTGLVFASTSNKTEEAEGLILRTEDGGDTWQPVYQSRRKMELIWKASFINDKYGYATVQSYDKNRSTQLIVKTTDGGKNWTELTMTENNLARQFGIGFVDKNHGWVGTLAGGFYTNNGGRTFTKAPVEKAANKFQVVKSETGTTIYSIGTKIQKLTIGTPKE